MKKYFARLSPVERRFVVVVMMVAFLVVNALFVWPRFSDWGKLRIRLGTAGDKLTKYQAKIEQVKGFEPQIKAMESEGANVPPEDQAVEFVRAIQSQAIQSGVSIIRNDPQPPRGTNQFFVEKAQNLMVQSGEGPLVGFLYRLGEGNSLIRVRDLVVRRDNSGQQLSATIKLVASYQKKPTVRLAATPAAAATSTNSAVTKR